MFEAPCLPAASNISGNSVTIRWTTNQLATFTTTMQTVNTNYLNAMLQLSTDIGTMADRIVYTEELIGQMADRDC
jgi:hypothetical protein